LTASRVGARKCLFCTDELGPGTRSREHVIPDWILRRFSIGDYVISPKAWDGGSEILPERRHPLASFRLGGVCRQCNEGWMSTLEQRASSNLLALSDGGRKTGGLAHPEQAVLARWAAKTALVVHAASYPYSKIPHSIYTNLRTSKGLPPGVSVLAMQTDGLADDIPPVTALQSDRYMFVKRRRTAEPLGCWKVSLRVGILQLLVCHCPDTSWEPLGWRNVHQGLWPTKVRLWYDARLRKDMVTVRKESGTVLFHLSLALTSGLDQSEINLMPRLPLEEELERFFISNR
jgi:hypothetical protein